MLVLTDKRECSLLCVLAYRAGVDHYQRGFLGRVGRLVAHLDRHSHKSLAVSLVLLATERQHERAAASSALCKMRVVLLAHLPHIFLLLLYFLSVNRSVTFDHKPDIAFLFSLRVQIGTITHYKRYYNIFLAFCQVVDLTYRDFCNIICVSL